MSQHESLELSVVMPCLDEARTIEACIRAAQAFFAESGVIGEVVIADNGSTDGSQDLARTCGARVVDVAQKGYGAALSGGIRAARAPFVIMGDADCSYDFRALMPFWERLRDGADLVMGNRFQGGIRAGAMPWKNRLIGNPLLSGIGRRFFRAPVGDFHCGLRGFSLDAFQRMDLRTTGMEFASEMVIKATLLKMRIDEVACTLSPDGRDRPPHLRPWRDGWRHLRFMLLYSPRWLFLYPGIFLFLAGMLLGLWLLPGPRTVAGTVFDVHTLLFAGMAMIIGFQAITFAVFSKVYAIQAGLLPPSQILNRLFRFITLEVGIVVAMLMMLLGLSGALWAVGAWGRQDFGPLDPASVLRIVIPSGVLLALGCQALLSSFFLSVLGMGLIRERPFEED